jgi:2-polyprenyl-3-methyl-5-hydroxy-6-metoxy-1,4-benzoquinol methylase
VLEIVCGSGLVTIPIAAQGLDVTGVDLARPMLKHARKKAEAKGLKGEPNSEPYAVQDGGGQ